MSIPRIEIIKQEISAWENTQYQLEIRYATSKALEDTPEVLADIRKQVERCVKAIAFLESKLAELVKPKAV